jgi:thiazole synthase
MQLQEDKVLDVIESAKAETKTDVLKIAHYELNSRLIVGTGKYKDFDQTKLVIEASGAQMVTCAVRRVNIGQKTDEPNLLDYLSPDRYIFLPNTAFCYTAADAIRVCEIARELLDGHRLVKLEIMGDEKTMYPNILETLRAAETLVKKDFLVMVYTNDDPIVAKELANIGCVAVMPLAAPIGSGLGIQNRYTLKFILEEAQVPIIVDAGVGTASDAAIGMELGCDAVLMNTALAQAKNPVLMASAMQHAVKAGRQAYLAGRMPKRLYASASSPTEGIFW